MVLVSILGVVVLIIGLVDSVVNNSWRGVVLIVVGLVLAVGGFLIPVL